MSTVSRLRKRALVFWNDRAALAWMFFVAVVYGAATFVRSQAGSFGPDHMMVLADDMLSLHRVDLTSLNTINDVVTIDGRHYQAMSLLPTVPYFVFVPFKALWPWSRWIVSAVIGTLAAWTALPLARRYGPGGSAGWWLATLGAFGTLLFTLSIEGDFYYLAHLESLLLISLALIEWKGARRAWVIGLLIGIAGLARPTLWLAAVPFGLALLWEAGASSRPNRSVESAHVAQSAESSPSVQLAPSVRSTSFDLRSVLSTSIAFGLPLAASLAVTGWFDWVRFGSPLETGYTLSYVTPALDALRQQGLFSVVHLPANLGLFIFGGIDHVRSAFPWIVPSTEGHSIFLTTPAILIALNAGLHNRTNLVLWASAVLAAIPVFLYYGGGGSTTYGFRYEMDFMPFLIALVAVAADRHFGRIEKALIALSVVFVCYGFVWQVWK